ncbi:MAG: LCP family protein [Roseiflexus sp.]|jgi:LCP family protein required for cell wall assembly|nr:LCP family protein [Roseiflexus sp.]MBO9333379.1 LCP family protein [Roseiflexus sp.]MBO9365880.1 LCP family protein [Roseiflexus sp.]MBO9383220.1 LCP family protein [Roseiflexus sp.]MBO9388947.1 LCP family protein [Roseiflexus sp.]
MDRQTLGCREARQLIDQGVSPGSTRPKHRTLGFHLARCAACRAYRAQKNDTLLATLLETPPCHTSLPSADRRRLQYPIRLIRAISLTLMGIAAVLTLIFLGRMAVAFAAILGHMDAMTRNAGQTIAGSSLGTLPTELATLIPPTLPPPPWASADPPTTFAPSVTTTVAAATVSATPTTASVEALPISATPEKPSPTITAALPVLPTITPIPLRPDYRPGASTPALAPLPTLSAGYQRTLPAGQAITVLLLGLDRRPGETFPSRADAIIVARIEPERQRVALLSLPRDLVVPIPGWGWSRINAAMVYGELNPALGGGIALTRRTVSEFLSIPIDYTVIVDFTGFIGAIDAIGGVTINVPVELYDPNYPTMDYRYTVAHFRPGVQHMDGARALMYARIRHMDSDWERMKRQQTVIIAALNQVRERNALEQVESIAALTSALRGFVITDIPETQLLGLAWAFRDFAPDQVERYALDASSVSIGAPGDPYAQYALPGAIERLRAQLLGS